MCLCSWAAGAWGLCYQLTFLQSLLFGSIISATDPVSLAGTLKQQNFN